MTKTKEKQAVRYNFGESQWLPGEQVEWDRLPDGYTVDSVTKLAGVDEKASDLQIGILKGDWRATTERVHKSGAVIVMQGGIIAVIE